MREMAYNLEQLNDKVVCELLEQIGQSGIKVMMFLLRTPESNKFQMQTRVGMGPNSLSGTVFKLYKLGLIGEKEGRGTEMLYFLTDKGRKVAEHLDAAEKILAQGA